MKVSRFAPVAGLLLLSPVGAELLSAYQGQFGDPLGLLVQLVVAVPLYGTAALLVRELTRRARRGWPTMLLLAAAFGLVQAGLVDQGLFNPHYIDDPSWAADRQRTLVPGLDLSISYLVTFVGGHVLWSFGAPIAVVEATVPRAVRRPWLGRAGLVVTSVVYVLAAAFVVTDHVGSRQFVVSPLQLGVTVAAVLALVVLAFALPRSSARRAGRVPPAWLVGAVAVVVCGVHTTAPPTWLGVAASVLGLGVVGALLLAWSARAGWTGTHVLAAGCAPLVTNVLVAFAVAPEGATPAPKYVSNVVVAACLFALLAWAWWRTRRGAPTWEEEHG